MANQIMEGYSAPLKRGILKNKPKGGVKSFNERQAVFILTCNFNFRHFLEKRSKHFFTS
jgi:hypothetical protein